MGVHYILIGPILPKQSLPLRVPGGFSSGPVVGSAGDVQLRAPTNLSVFTVFREGRSRLVQAKRSVDPLFYGKTHMF